MGADFYLEAQADAAELITDFGRPITLRHANADPITTLGVYLEAEENKPFPGAQSRRSASATIEAVGKYLIADVGVELDPLWWIEDGGKRLSVVRVRVLKPATTIVLNELYVGA